MRALEPLPLNHSWPLIDAAARLDQGLLDAPFEDRPGAMDDRFGAWRCDLADNSLTWSNAVYRLFGFPPGSRPSRGDSVQVYCEPSRAAMERLRSYAIRHRRGFTIDVELTPHDVGRRWIRLTAAPAFTADRVTHLYGVKRDVSSLYL